MEWLGTVVQDGKGLARFGKAKFGRACKCRICIEMSGTVWHAGAGMDMCSAGQCGEEQ